MDGQRREVDGEALGGEFQGYGGGRAGWLWFVSCASLLSQIIRAGLPDHRVLFIPELRSDGRKGFLRGLAGGIGYKTELRFRILLLGILLQAVQEL